MVQILWEFEELPGEVVERYIGKGSEKPKTIEELLSQNNPVEFISIASGLVNRQWLSI